VRWVLPGEAPIEGRDAVVAASDRVAAVDAVGRYLSSDGSLSVVSSADIYEFDGAGLLTTITSYAVELHT
jgi:hypothetical protein